MSKKVSPTAATATPVVSVSTASVVATRTLTTSPTTASSATTTTPIAVAVTVMPTKNKTAALAKNSPTTTTPAANHAKSHPKTLDIPGTPSKKTTTMSAALLTNGATTAASSIKTDKRGAPKTAPATTITCGNKLELLDSPQRANGIGGAEEINFKEIQKDDKQKNVSPTSSFSSSSSSPSSSSTSGIHSSQFAAICREVGKVREEHFAIRKCLSERDGELGKTRMTLRNIAEERDILRNKVSELEHILKHSPEMHSHVAAMLSNSNSLLLSGKSSPSPQSALIKPGFQTNSSTPSPPSSSKHSPEEISPTLTLGGGKNNNSHGHYAPVSSTMKSSSAVVSSPVRNIVQQHQQQNQKLTSLPSSPASHSRPNIAPAAAVAVAGGNLTGETMGSPRKCNGNEGNLKRKGCLVGMEEIQRVAAIGRAGGGGGGVVGGVGSNAFLYSPRPSSPNISNNINSQESHQASHNNKNLHQQHSMQQHQQQNKYFMNNMKHTTTTTTFTAAAVSSCAADKNKSIYYTSHHHELGPRATPPPPAPSLSLQYLEYHNGNSRNVNGNDIPAMTNSNNNNNHLKSTSAAGGGGREVGGGGGGQHHHHDYHRNQHHLSQSGMTGLDLMLLGPDCSTKMVEHLVHPMSIESSVREIQHTLVLKGVPLNGDRLREVEIEIDRLNSRIDHLRSQNDVLTLNLEDAKSHADRLTVLLGKYESNNVALQLALRYSDQMSDAYQVLAALLETELGQVVTSIHAAGQLHLICAPPPNNTAAAAAESSTSGAVVVSRSGGATSSGNNNNSNGCSPSENVPLASPTSSTAVVAASAKNGTVELRDKQCGKNNNNNGGHETDIGSNNNDHNHNSSDNNNDTATAATTSSPDESSCGMAMVTVKNRSDPEKTISPTSPSPSSTPSAKAMNLVEQARRNRLAAEQAARFLLSRFSSASINSSTHGVVISPTESNNNNGHGGVGSGIDTTSSFLFRPTCQSNSTTSINSVTSNLSNTSGENDGGQESASLSSPEVDEKNVEKQQKQQHNQRQRQKKGQEQTSTAISEQDGMEVAINGGNMKSSTTAVVAVNGSSPTSSSTTTTTFRAPFSPNGNNGPLNGTTSIITSLLPLLRNAARQQQLHNNPSSGNNGSSEAEAVSAAIESTIRHLISTLKAERDAVKQTVMELESESLESLTPSPKPSSPYYSNGNNNNNNNSSSSNGTPTAAPWSPSADARKLDLETAVLMQELMAMKEERAELRAQLFLLEKEKGSLELRLRSHESQEDAYQARINYLKSEIMDCKSLHSATAAVTTTTVDTYHQDRNQNDIVKTQQQQQKNNGNNRNLETIINNNNNNQNANWEREALLKKRIHELAGTLEKVTMSSQVREKQNQEMINELNRANGILMQTLDVAKKKYQNRIKKMEDQILYVSERHAAQLKLFGDKMPTARQYPV